MLIAAITMSVTIRINFRCMISSYSLVDPAKRN
jgi:hypothetical protein